MRESQYNVKRYPVFNRELKDLPGEKWMDIPGCWDRYAISNFGRVKSLARIVDRSPKGCLSVKERILKPCISKKPLILSNEPTNVLKQYVIGNDKKKHTFINGRLVYELFVEKFDINDANLYIGYKDNDSFNVYYKNLKLVTRSETQLACYSKPQRWRPTKAISQYHYNGELIRTYNSIVEAAHLMNTGTTAIWLALNGRLGHCRGFIWRYGQRKKIKGVKYPIKKTRRIAQYSLNNDLIKTFASITEACSKTGFDYQGILKTAKKRRESYKGYKWRYIDV